MLKTIELKDKAGKTVPVTISGLPGWASSRTQSLLESFFCHFTLFILLPSSGKMSEAGRGESRET
jgi:hypothetical protein